MANRYLIASGNWSNPAIWSATSGGAGGAGVPTASDAVYIEANFAVSLTADATCGEISHTSGTLSLSSFKLTVAGLFGPGRFYSYGSTARTINLDSGSLVLNGTAFDATVLSIAGTNLTLNAGTSQIVINAGYGDPADFGASTFDTGNHTFNDVVINLGADSQAVEFNMTGYPKFRNLLIQAKNDAPHNVNFPDGVNKIEKFVAIGASALKKLSLSTRSADDSIQYYMFIDDNGSVYGQNLSVWDAYIQGYDSLDFVPFAYVGTNSVGYAGDYTTNGGWTHQNPPKTETLVDPLTTDPASNANWIAPSYSGASFPNTTNTGLSGGGYRFGNKDGLISSGTYDFTESSMVFEIPPISTTSSINTLHVMIGWGKNDGSAYIGESSQTAYSGYGFDIKPSSGNYPSSTVKYYRSYGSADSTANFSVPASTKYIRLVCSGGYFKTEISDTGSTWTEQATFATTPDDELLLKSSRVYITTDITGSDSNTIDIGSINPELGPQVPTANFTASPTSGVAQLPVTFTDTSSGIPDTWSWNFGDGGTSTAQNPSHTYTSPGLYTVTLNASNSLGSDSETKTGYITVSLATVSPSSIASVESVGSPSVQPGTANMVVGSASSAEAFGTATLSLNLSPGSIASAEAFGTLLVTLPLASIGGITSAESVSAVSFTTQFITTDDITSQESFGTLVLSLFLSGIGGIAGEVAMEPPTFVQSAPPPPPPTDWSALGKEDEKVFVYKVSDSAGNYIGVWSDVKDDFTYTQAINTPGTTTTVQLARSANTTKEVRSALLTQAGDDLITEDGATLIATYLTSNVVGEDTDVELNYNVDVYAHYGEFADLTTQDGSDLITQNEDTLIVASGAPLGIRVFSGFVLDYEADYSAEEVGVTVTLSSNGWELSNELIRSGETTTVTYASTPIEAIVKSILDTNPGKMSYDSASIQTTGVTTGAKFQLNTKLEGIESVFNQAPSDWYYFGNPADNLVYLKQRSTTADHVFIIGKHVKSVKTKRSIENLKNVLYFVGGEVTPGDPSTTLFKKYTRPTSETTWRKGLERIVDRRYTVATHVQNRADRTLDRFKDPIYTTPLVISSAKYDIESIKLGQTVSFRNAGNFIDNLPPVQIVNLSYTPTAVTLQLGEVQERQVDSIAEVEDGLANEQYENLPTIPS